MVTISPPQTGHLTPIFRLAAAPLAFLPAKLLIRSAISGRRFCSIIFSVSLRIKLSSFPLYSQKSTVPLVIPSSPFSQLAVIFGLRSAGTVMYTTSNTISPRLSGVSICVFLLRFRYPIRTSFWIISALVAEVPIPEPFICSRSSSSSISCPAFSMASTMEPDV